jgi:hypothetical protein
MSIANVDHGSRWVAGRVLLLIALVAGCGGSASPSPTPTPSGSADSVFTSVLRYQAVPPSGWTLSAAAGSRHYDEFESSDGLSAIRIQVFEGSTVVTLGDMTAADVKGILAHDGSVIESQRDLTLSNGAGAHRIGYSIQSGGASEYGIDVLTLSDGRGALMTLLSNDPITPTLQTAFDQMANSLVVLP